MVNIFSSELQSETCSWAHSQEQEEDVPVNIMSPNFI